MIAAQSPLSDSQIQGPKSNRKPLQPKNTPPTPITNTNLLKPNLNTHCFDISQLLHHSNKENIHPLNGTTTTTTEEPKVETLKMESFDGSLAEELSAIRQKLERLKADRDDTENMLKERDLMLDMQLKQLQTRGELQKQLEIEVDRLYRLKELRLFCMRISPIRSLREKEQDKRIKDDEAKDISMSNQETGDTRDDNPLPTPDSDFDEDN